MIRYRAQTLLIYDASSQTAAPLDQDALQQRLEQAFIQSGIHDHTIPVAVLDTFLLHHQQASPPVQLTMDELVSQLAQILRTLGHSETAEHFTELSNAPQPAIASEVPSPEERAAAVEALPPVMRPTRYLGANEWNLPLSPDEQLLLLKRVIVLLPISDAHPVISVECRPSRLYDLPISPQTELELHAQLSQLTRHLWTILGLMQERVRQLWKTDPEPTCQITFLEINALVQLACPGRHAKRRQQYSLQLRKELTESLRQTATCQLLLDFSD